MTNIAEQLLDAVLQVAFSAYMAGTKLIIMNRLHRHYHSLRNKFTTRINLKTHLYKYYYYLYGVDPISKRSLSANYKRNEPKTHSMKHFFLC